MAANLLELGQYSLAGEQTLVSMKGAKTLALTSSG
jgi:hypothetical protein